MSPVWGWLLLLAAALVGGFSLALAAWLIRSRLRERRKARYFAELSAQYQKPRPALRATEEPPRHDQPDSRMVTVEELMARIESEGLAVRLRWDKDRLSEGD